MSIYWLAAAIVVLAVGLTVALDRQLKRAERDRRLREWAKTSPEFQRIARNFDALRLAIGAALLPAMTDMAAALSEFGKAANEREEPRT